MCFRCGFAGVEVFVNGAKVTAQMEGNTVVISDVKPADRVEIHLQFLKTE